MTKPGGDSGPAGDWHREGQQGAEPPFWKTKTLEEMNQGEWESLCDGCGLCCLNKLEDWETGEIAWTEIHCTLLDGESCRCRDYPNRQETVPDCIQLTPEAVRTLAWLPPSCGYRKVRDGEDLSWWHPLVSGDPDTVHQAGISARGRTVSEDEVDLDDFEDYVVDWPLDPSDGKEK
ncbi:YcgN family cysteine cluster protein [Xaviernesmea rhizosphaerae]|uniref:YcgN family cysteine cluster protein n=1 Tax=Xaviernesmea rhizosphaerae TaxID=1672749 RepID=UPI0024780CEA|nr:YcgN family cysteine cluster protein [Xaviernesmea rhizosphaerae]